jgi:hypothetical protein
MVPVLFEEGVAHQSLKHVDASLPLVGDHTATNLNFTQTSGLDGSPHTTCHGAGL